MEIAKDAAQAVMLASQFEASIYTPAMVLHWANLFFFSLLRVSYSGFLNCILVL